MLGGSDKVAQGVSHAAQNAPAGAARDTLQADGADIPLVLPELSDFTTEGKPTKTIETPWGPREVYDALQDQQLKKVFERWYSENQYAIVDYAEYLGATRKKSGIFFAMLKPYKPLI